MKNLFLICLLTFSANLAFAQTFNDIEEGQVLVFDQTMKLPTSALTKDKAVTTITIKKGDKIKISQIQNLDSINVMVFVGHLEDCPSPTSTTVMEIVKILNREPSTDVGVMLEEKCQLSVFIETKELYHPTFFAN